MNPARKKLARLRALMKDKGIDAFIIPGTDPHLGEYVPEHWRIVQWLTGFTGSAATVVVTSSFAGLWTDSRYFSQAVQQLEGSGVRLMKISMPPYPSFIDWLSVKVKKDSIIAFDGRLLSVRIFRLLKEKLQSQRVVINTDADLISDMWENRPPVPGSVAFEHAAVFSGEDRSRKMERVREEMLRTNTDHCLLTSPDDIMWLLNIRANDTAYSPLLLSFAIIGRDQVLLFTSEDKIPFRLATEFDKLGIVILGYDEVSSVLSALPARTTLLLNPSYTSTAMYNSIPERTAIREGNTIPSVLKAVKNSTEIKNLEEVMLKDGAALSKFLYWLEKTVPESSISEGRASEKLLEFRLQQTNCIGESFPTIMAWNEHAALPHYTPDQRTDTLIGPRGVLLVDSGGQYLDGTTDITRCIAFGKPSLQQKTDFTLALKGTISLATARFPYGTLGYQLDVLARRALWQHGLNYGHGTGHGVGSFLNVHEGPQSISPSADGPGNVVLEPGMLLSDEPAIYRDGEYGFRTENLILVSDDIENVFGRFLAFRTMSLCYIDTELIDQGMLGKEELDWLNDYHKRVYTRLSPLLDENEKKWLQKKTLAL